MDYKNIIETILLVCEKPISNSLIRTALKVDLSDSDIKDIINVLNDEYKKNKKGIYIAFVSEAYQIRTLPEFHEYISIIQNNNKQYRLSNAGLEVLSIIAFKQPVSRLDIEAIRGVDSIGVIKKLLDNNLIIFKKSKKQNRKQIFYKTTDFFLETFGLNKIEDLTTTQDIKEILKQS